MKNLITPEEVSRRATSPESALEVSIDVWRQKCEMNEKEMKEIDLGDERCGLCQYYGMGSQFECGRKGHGSCIIHPEGGLCCAEYNFAQKTWTKWKDGKATLSEVKSAFYAMLDRLEREKAKLPKKEAKPETKHGDYGMRDEEVVVCFNRCTSPINVGEGEHIQALPTFTASNSLESHLTGYEKFGNLFDELEGMDGEMREFKGKSLFASPYKIFITAENNICLSQYEGDIQTDIVLSRPEARRFFRAGLVLCANAEKDKGSKK